MEVPLRVQAIKKYLIDKKEESPTITSSPRIRNIHAIETAKFKPILTTRIPRIQPSIRPRVFKSSGSNSKRLRDISPLNCSSALVVFNSQTTQSAAEKSIILSSSSANIIKPFSKIPRFKCKMNKPNHQTLRKNLKTAKDHPIRETSKLKEVKAASKADIEKLWRKCINSSNGIEASVGSFATYTVYIGKGNNSPLVKRLLTARTWWKVVESKDTANFVWTQWRDKQVLSDLKCHDPNIVYESQNFSPVNTVSDITGLSLIVNSASYLQLICEKILPEQQRLHNKLEFNFCITNKKGLYNTMKSYYKTINKDPFGILPLTFCVTGEDDAEYKEFLQTFSRYEDIKNNSNGIKNIWIIKPGEFTNRGTGINVCQNLEEISALLKSLEGKSLIIQKYIENPLLINKRKFDIRCYSLVTSINGVIQGYFYLDGYLRTTSTEFTMAEISNLFIHLTNDAIQKHSTDYGKFENGNKLSYREFQRYLDLSLPEKKINFLTNILPKIKEIIKDTLKASFLTIDKNRRLNCMEIFGYDFMLDEQLNPWLIEVNTNPCLETSSMHLCNIIPAMLENVFRLTIDNLFPPPIGHGHSQCSANRFELIFSQEIDGKALPPSLGDNNALILA